MVAANCSNPNKQKSAFNGGELVVTTKKVSGKRDSLIVGIVVYSAKGWTRVALGDGSVLRARSNEVFPFIHEMIPRLEGIVGTAGAKRKTVHVDDVTTGGARRRMRRKTKVNEKGRPVSKSHAVDGSGSEVTSADRSRPWPEIDHEDPVACQTRIRIDLRESLEVIHDVFKKVG